MRQRLLWGFDSSGECFRADCRPRPIAVRCGSFFDGRWDSLRKNVVVVIEGEKIKELATVAPARF